MSDEPTKVDSSIHQIVKDVLMSPEFIEKLKVEREAKRPAGTSSRSVFSYYKEEYGIAMKIVIDQLMIDGKPKIFLYSDFGISKNSLYLRVQQGLQFLLEQMDSDGKYKEIRGKLQVNKEPGLGVQVSLASSTINGRPFVPKDIDHINRLDYKDEIDKFLNDEKLKIYKEKVTLTNEEVATLNDSLAPLTFVAAVITNTEIKIVKI